MQRELNLFSSAYFQHSRPTSAAVNGTVNCCCNFTKQNPSPLFCSSSVGERNDSGSLMATGSASLPAHRAYHHEVSCFLYSLLHVDSSQVMSLICHPFFPILQLAPESRSSRSTFKCDRTHFVGHSAGGLPSSSTNCCQINFSP